MPAVTVLRLQSTSGGTMRLAAGKPFQVNWNGEMRCIKDSRGNSYPMSFVLNGGADKLGRSIASDQHLGFVRDGKTVNGLWVPSDIYGFVMAKPIRLEKGLAGFDGIADDPDALTWFISANPFTGDSLYNHERSVLVANAARKLRLLASLCRGGSMSTMEIMAFRERFVLNPVRAAEPDGTILWGDFPWAGGVIVVVGKWLLMGAVSGFTGPEDHVQASKALVRVGQWLDVNGIEEIVEVEPRSA